MGIEEGEEVQVKRICYIFNKIIVEDFSNLEKGICIQIQEASKKPNIFDQNRTTHDILSLNHQAQRVESRE
jgi:hypothetical protein